MTTQYYSGPDYGGRFLAYLLALVLGAVAFAGFVRCASTGKAERIATFVTGRAIRIEPTAANVVEKIQHMARMDSVVYSLDTVVEGGRPTMIPPDAPTGDRVLLLVHGDSVAGIDLGQTKPQDVRIDAGGRGIHVTLPAAQIFSTTLDDRRTHVIVRTTGQILPADQALEPETRARAQDQLQQSAQADGILDAARKNARTTVAALLTSLGFEQVDVN